jgi:phenylacetate-CoA ligase
LLNTENGGLNILSYINHIIGSNLHRNVFFLLYWKYIRRSNVLKYYQKLKTHQWNTWEENKKIQQKKLYKLIEYASKNIPYYEKVIKEYNIKFSEDTIFDDLKKFPLLTKDIIRNNFDKLFKFRDNTYYRNSSGGSTGEPLIFYQDNNYFAWNTANQLHHALD